MNEQLKLRIMKFDPPRKPRKLICLPSSHFSQEGQKVSLTFREKGKRQPKSQNVRAAKRM